MCGNLCLVCLKELKSLRLRGYHISKALTIYRTNVLLLVNFARFIAIVKVDTVVDKSFKNTVQKPENPQLQQPNKHPDNMKTIQILIAVFSILFTLGFSQGVYAQNQPVEVMSPVVSFLNNDGQPAKGNSNGATQPTSLTPQERTDLVKTIIEIIGKGKTEKMINWKLNDGKEFPYFKFHEITIKVLGKNVTIQSFPPTPSSSKDPAEAQKATPGSLSFFWNEVDPQTNKSGRWSLSMSLQGNVETGVCPVENQIMILTVPKPVGEELKGFWQSKADEMIQNILVKLKPAEKLK